MNRLQRIALAPFVAAIEIVLIAVFLSACACAFFESAKTRKP